MSLPTLGNRLPNVYPPPTDDDFSKTQHKSAFVDSKMDSGRSEITVFWRLLTFGACAV